MLTNYKVVSACLEVISSCDINVYNYQPVYYNFVLIDWSGGTNSWFRQRKGPFCEYCVIGLCINSKSLSLLQCLWNQCQNWKLLFRPTLLGRMRREIVELSSISKQGGELRSSTATHLLSSRAPDCWVLQVVQGNVTVLTPALSREAAVNAVKVTATTSWFSLTRESERGWGVTTRCSQPAAGCVQSLHAGF